jgi:hypothetical protein
VASDGLIPKEIRLLEGSAELTSEERRDLFLVWLRPECRPGLKGLGAAVAMGAVYVPPENKARISSLVGRWLGEDSLAAREPSRKPKPRHRPPAQIAKATVKSLMWELEQRKAKPKNPELTQEEIAGRLELKVTRVQQAEALERVGWPLLRTHPDFPVDEGFVRWPGPAKAAQILASERTEN